MPLNSLRDLTRAFVLKSPARRGCRALLPALALLLCLAVPAWADVTPKQSDANALARIKRANDTNNRLGGANWTGSPVIYNNANGVTWNKAKSSAQVTNLYVNSKQLTGKLDAGGMAALIKLNASRNQLTGLDVRKNSALKWLYASMNDLTGLDVSKNTALAKLDVAYNQITELDMSANTALTELNATYNHLTGLDVSKNSALKWLYASMNELTGLDVSQNTALKELYASHNQLTSLDVSKNAELTELHAIHNHITGLDVSQNTALTKLYVSYNQFSDLDVSKNTKLEELYAASLQLTSLDVSQNPALKELIVSHNQLTSLDISKNAAMAEFDVCHNQITSLDVSQNPALAELYASHNQLTGLDVSQNSVLRSLDVSHNQLTELDVSKNTALTGLYVSGNPLNSLNLAGLNSLRLLGISETGLSLDSLSLSSPGQLLFLELDLDQLDLQDFSALTSLSRLIISDSDVTDLILKRYATLVPGQITSMTIIAPQAVHLDFSNYASNLRTLYIKPGRLERISGAAGLDKAKFEYLSIDSNRLPLSQIAPLALAVNQKDGTTIDVVSQSQVWFESMTAKGKPFDLSEQLAPEWTLGGKATRFELLPASAVAAYPDGTVLVNRSLALKQGDDYTLSSNGSLKIARTGQYYLLMSNPALYNWEHSKRDGILALSGLLDYQE